MSSVFSLGVNSLSFRRTLTGVKLEEWRKLLSICANVELAERDDKLIWLLSASKQFTVKSFYLAMQAKEGVPSKFWWRIKIPLRIKTFMWLVLRKSILTRDVLLTRGGECAKSCLFCGQDESIDHLFVHCPLASHVWNVVSVATGLRCQFVDVQHCLNDWLNGFGKKQRKKIAVGVAVIFWGLWKTRNLTCFENKWPVEPL